MENSKKNTYNYEAQKKYNANSIHIGLKFIASEKETVEKQTMLVIK